MIKYFYKGRNITSPQVERRGEVYSVIWGGLLNSASGYYSGTFSGTYNTVSAGYNFGFIGGGAYNMVSANYGSILGGGNNTVSGTYSSILGGSGNNDNGFNYAGIFGQGIGAVAANTFHVGALWMQPGSYPTYPGITPTGWFPQGTIYADSSSGYLLRIQV